MGGAVASLQNGCVAFAPTQFLHTRSGWEWLEGPIDFYTARHLRRLGGRQDGGDALRRCLHLLPVQVHGVLQVVARLGARQWEARPKQKTKKMFKKTIFQKKRKKQKNG